MSDEAPRDPLAVAVKRALEGVHGAPDPDDLERRARRRRALRATRSGVGTMALVAAVAASLFLLSPLLSGDRNRGGSVAPGQSAHETTTSPSPTAGGGAVTPTAPASVEPSSPSGLDSPPPVTLRFSDQSIELHAYTYCYGNVCADGAPPSNPPDVGHPEDVSVDFPLAGWTFTAFFTPAGERCGRTQQIRLESSGDGEFVVRPAGHSGTYDVTLFGRGDGDLAVTFRWTTPTDGPLPKPEARLTVLSGHDGDIGSYGVELEVTNLARTPTEASATITVRASSGKAITFEAIRAKRPCFPEGTVYWDGPDEQGRAAAALGDGPFTYEVQLLLDGVRYVATAEWPADEIRGNEPSVALQFTPDLPALP